MNELYFSSCETLLLYTCGKLAYCKTKTTDQQHVNSYVSNSIHVYC